MPTDFNPTKPNAPAFTSVISRNYYEKVLCDSNIQYERNVPGPGKHEVVKKLGQEATKFSLYGRINDRIIENAKVPGPGEYKSISTNQLGKFAFSNIKNTTNIIWATGPRTYAAFSEFGIYRSKNADKFEAFSANKLNNSGEKATMK